jgi:GTP cyclohydrolase I
VPDRDRATIGDYDAPRVEAAIRELLIGVGEDPDREGLRDTPARVARAFAETSRVCARGPRTS